MGSRALVKGGRSGRGIRRHHEEGFRGQVCFVKPSLSRIICEASYFYLGFKNWVYRYFYSGYPEKETG